MNAPIKTAFGEFAGRFTEQGLAELRFPTGAQAAKGSAHCARAEWIRLTRAAIVSVLSGKQPAELPPLDLSTGTDFQREVWNALLRIPSGATQNYAAIARQLGKPNAARAVGNACGANPIPLLIPCHRVLASGGRLGGFSGGLDWKRRLLSIEGTAFR